MNLKRVARSLWTRSPRENWQRVRDRGERPPAWTHGKHRQWNRLPYYLTMFDKMSARYGTPLSFTGKHVLEIGGGPALGLAPFALLDGAASFTLIEPDFEEIRGDDTFAHEYLEPLWSVHGRLVAGDARPSFAVFRDRIAAIDVHAKPIETLAGGAHAYDVIVSKSCLEHIADLPRAMDVCRDLASPTALHAHYVDFAMHRQHDRVGGPFGKTYVTARADNPERLGGPDSLVNLLRASDVATIFAERFAKSRLFPLAEYPVEGEVHPDWAAYRREDLAVANAVVMASGGRKRT